MIYYIFASPSLFFSPSIHVWFCCRMRSGQCSTSGSKACREKMRRDRLNDRHALLFFLSYFILGVIFQSLPCWPKGSWNWVLSWSLEDLLKRTRLLCWVMLLEWWLSCVVKHRSWRNHVRVCKRGSMNWRSACNFLSNIFVGFRLAFEAVSGFRFMSLWLHGRTLFVQAEKNELRDEKQRLKTEKEKILHQVKALSSAGGFLPHPPAIPAPFASPGQVVGGKMMPFIGYPGVSMWQFMPPAAIDTSQDHVLRPPVA